MAKLFGLSIIFIANSTWQALQLKGPYQDFNKIKTRIFSAPTRALFKLLKEEFQQ